MRLQPPQRHCARARASALPVARPASPGEPAPCTRPGGPARARATGQKEGALSREDDVSDFVSRRSNRPFVEDVESLLPRSGGAPLAPILHDRQPAGELLSAQPRMRPPSGAARRAPSAATPARSRPRAWQSAQQRVQGSDLLAVTAAASPARRSRNALCAFAEGTGSLSAGAQQRCSEGLEVEP